MSKVNAMQAMREARYAAARTARPAATVPPAATVQPVPRTRPADRPVGGFPSDDAAAELDDVSSSDAVPRLEPVAEPEAQEALCGHRSMNNRSCRRPAGHPEKNHRYN